MNFPVKAAKRKKVGSLQGLEVDEHTEDEESEHGYAASRFESQAGSGAPLVIPLPEKKTLGVATASLDEQAAKELLDEVTGERRQRGGVDSRLTIAISDEIASKRPLLLSSLPAELLGEMDDEVRFKKDVSLRAEDIPATSSAYASIPVHEFGAAMLRGMGWTDPSKEEAELLNKKYSGPIVARESRVGLGATAKPPDASSRGTKEHKAKEKAKWVEKANEKIKSQQLSEGNFVWIRDPVYAGRRAVIVAAQGVPGLDRVRVSMESDGSLVELKKGDVVVLSESELQAVPYRGVVPLVARSGHDGGRKRSTHSENGGGGETSSVSGVKNKKHKSDGGSPLWLRAGIRVRVVSKKVGVSSYLQKASVVTVDNDGVASLRLDDGSLVEGVKQKALETVLPSCGQLVMALVGQHAGTIGKLVEKQKEQELVIVQITGGGADVILSMDHCAALA